MVKLIEVTDNNFYDCLELKYVSNYVSDPVDIIAMAYIYREYFTVYGIYNDDTPIGLVSLIRDNRYNTYGFTDMIIADLHKSKGFGNEAIKCIIDFFNNEGRYNSIEIKVHKSNDRAIHIYEKNGFIKTGLAGDFIVMVLKLNQ